MKKILIIPHKAFESFEWTFLYGSDVLKLFLHRLLAKAANSYVRNILSCAYKVLSRRYGILKNALVVKKIARDIRTKSNHCYFKSIRHAKMSPQSGNTFIFPKTHSWSVGWRVKGVWWLWRRLCAPLKITAITLCPYVLGYFWTSDTLFSHFLKKSHSISYVGDSVICTYKLVICMHELVSRTYEINNIFLLDLQSFCK